MSGDFASVDVFAPARYGGSRAGYPGGPSTPGPSSAAPAPPPTGVLFPPEFFPPPGALDFALQGIVTGSVANTWTVLATIALPANSLGIVRDVEATFAGTITTGSDLRFRVMRNLSPVPGWDDLRILGRSASSVSLSFLPESTYIRLPQDTTLQLAYFTGAAGFHVSLRARGWTWGV